LHVDYWTLDCRVFLYNSSVFSNSPSRDTSEMCSTALDCQVFLYHTHSSVFSNPFSRDTLDMCSTALTRQPYLTSWIFLMFVFRLY
jgi:hypothetical protein